MRNLDDRGVLAYFTQHRVAANLIMIVVILFGLVALNRLPTQLMPDYSLPGIEITTEWPEANAKSVEAYVTSPLEKSINQLDNVEEMWSWSNQGQSRIMVRYSMDTDMQSALADMSGLLTSFRDLPQGAETPRHVQMEDKEPVFSLLVSAPGPLTELQPLVHQFKSDLQARGIADVDVRGFPDHEIAVEFKLDTLLASDLSLNDISAQIAAANRDDSAGIVGTSLNRASVVSERRSESRSELAELPLANQQPLGSLAQVRRQVAEGARHYVLEDQSVARLLIYRSQNLDSLQTSDIVYQWLEEARSDLPAGVEISVWWDMSEFVRGNLDMLLENSLMGLLLVIAILFVFLNRRVAWWTALGIPVSVLGTFILLYLTGGSINFLAVFAFLMALGIIVDDAIVVGEETVTQMEKGLPPGEASLVAARRMFGPVMASSLTTIAAFFPLLLVPGFFGELLRPIPVVVISVIIASLIECFVILPGHLNHSFQGKKPGKSRFRSFMDNTVLRLRERIYRPFVSWAIHNRGVTVSIAVALCVVAYGMPISGMVPVTDMNNIEDNMVTAYAEFYDGTSEDIIEAMTVQMKATLAETELAYGEQGGIVDKVYEIYSADEGFTQVQARLVDRDNRPVSNGDFLKAWGERIETGSQVAYLSTSNNEGGNSDKTVSFFLAGRDLNTLKQGAEELKTRLKDYAGLANVRDTLPWGDEQREFKLNAAGKGLGLTESAVAAQIRQAFMGVTAQTFNENGQDIPVIVRLAKADREAPGALYDLPIRTPEGGYARLADVAEFKTTRGLGTLFHNNGQLGLEVKADVLGADANLGDIAKDIQKRELQPILDRYNLTAEIQGSAQDIEEMQQNLILAAIGGLAMIYFILVWVFGSYSWPLAVMAAIPLGLTGAIFGHWLLGFELTFLSFFGLFGLSGIIINDAIILINRYQEIRSEEDLPVKEAIIEASCQRFRAVLLTSITTVVGLVPILMADSVQAQLVQSMATSLAFGLAYGTLLVLVVIPCVLTFIESANSRRRQFGGWVRRKAFA